MTSNNFTHIAFSDESHWNTGRYRGIALVTMIAENYNHLNGELAEIIKSADISEFGFKKITETKYRILADKICNFTFRKVRMSDIRIDVLTWDTQDGRHNIRFRDDIRNFQIMYYHVFKNVLKRRWPDNARWRLCPDEQEQMDWGDLSEFLDGASVESQIVRKPLGFSKYSIEMKRRFGILDICPKKSHLEPFIQLADLFVGLGVYSREHYDSIERWQKENDTQTTLFRLNNDSKENISFSRSHQQRCPLVVSFDNKCKDNSMSVSLESNKGFKTIDPTKPINFWWYTPQHEWDRAPTSKQQTF